MLDTSSDKHEFGVIFLKLRGVLAPFKADKAEIRQVIDAYFAVLKPWPLTSVRLGADHCAARMKKFPKPAEWIEAIPKAKAAGLIPLTEDQADEYRAAIALGFESEPCACYLCQQANISSRPLRYVPDTDADGADIRRADGDKVVALGHWAHGDELATFYAARDRFWADFAALIGKRTIATAVAPLADIDDSMAANPEEVPF